MAVIGCGGEPTAVAGGSASSGREHEPERAAFERAHHMQASLWMAVVARDALIEGDLDQAKTAARALAVHDYETALPASWKTWIGEVQKQAGEITVAGGIGDASQSLAALALACGNCHYHQNGGPGVAPEGPVEWRDGPDTLEQRMDRHAQGAEQMWVGLVEPSEYAWRSGTVTLTRAPLEPPISESGAVAPRAADAIERVRAIARRARVAATYPERAQLYGELIATCSDCHTKGF